MTDNKTYTPMIEHFLSVKENYRDAILLYRMGDFYETFFDDAYILSKELGIVLTGKNTDNERIPMAGIPHHSLDNYLPKLIKKSYKIAICEQMEAPKPGKIVRREVVRVITPGTILENEFLSEKHNNYLASLIKKGNNFGLAFVDISTGQLKATQLNNSSEDVVASELSRMFVSECLIPENENYKEIIGNDISITKLSELFFNYDSSKKKILEHFKVLSLESFGLSNHNLAVCSVGALLSYIEKTQMRNLSQINRISVYNINDTMIIDNITKKNLELISTSRDNFYQGSLLSILDNTKTPMGSRLLKQYLLNPLINISDINKRLDKVEELYKNNSLRNEIINVLEKIKDLERLSSRISVGLSNARELISLSNSLKQIPIVSDILKRNNSTISYILLNPDNDLIELSNKISNTLVDNPPISVTDGGLIKNGINPELDNLKSLLHNDKSWLTELEKKEREKTGIKSLKISFNKAFGYFIEVSNSNKNLVPDYYIRKQTLVNAERYITPELKEKEELILTAEEKIKEIEYNIFCELRNYVGTFTNKIQLIASEIAKLDVFSSFAQTSIDNNYTRPILTNTGELIIEEGRHPVIEKIIPKGEFVSNSVYLNNNDTKLIILTGPNMAGKSTFMRQIALIILMAQIGIFVPAKKSIISICDRIFTRVGAIDDISTGQSTFMVEMNETANILNNATDKSFILLDEVGRGTSTFDGVSIAWAVSEYIVKHIGAKTIFATHYHELNKMEETLEGVKNFQVAVKETSDKIIFLHKVIPGYADKSYGVEVARLAGLPKYVINRARDIILDIEKRSKIQASLLKKSENKIENKVNQLSIFGV